MRVFEKSGGMSKEQAVDWLNKRWVEKREAAPRAYIPKYYELVSGDISYSVKYKGSIVGEIGRDIRGTFYFTPNTHHIEVWGEELLKLLALSMEDLNNE